MRRSWLEEPERQHPCRGRRICKGLKVSSVRPWGNLVRSGFLEQRWVAAAAEPRLERWVSAESCRTLHVRLQTGGKGVQSVLETSVRGVAGFFCLSPFPFRHFYAYIYLHNNLSPCLPDSVSLSLSVSISPVSRRGQPWAESLQGLWEAPKRVMGRASERRGWSVPVGTQCLREGLGSCALHRACHPALLQTCQSLPPAPEKRAGPPHKGSREKLRAGPM